MKVYLTSITNNYTEFNRVYKSINNSLEYIHDFFKSMSVESDKDCDFFDREYVQEYFTEDYLTQYGNVVCKSTYGEFIIKKICGYKYQFVYIPVNEDDFVICELEVLDLLD